MTPDKIKIVDAFVILIVSELLAALSSVKLPTIVFVVLVLLSNRVLPLLRLMAFAMLSEAPFIRSVAPLATVAVALLLPKPALFATINAPALMLVVPVKVFVPDRLNAPTPVLFNVILDPLNTPERVKTLFVALTTLIVLVPLSEILPLIVLAAFALSS